MVKQQQIPDINKQSFITYNLLYLLSKNPEKNMPNISTAPNKEKFNQIKSLTTNTEY